MALWDEKCQFFQNVNFHSFSQFVEIHCFTVHCSMFCLGALKVCTNSSKSIGSRTTVPITWTVVGIGGGVIFLTVSTFTVLDTFPVKVLVYFDGLDGLEPTTSCWVGLAEFWVWFTITGTCTVLSDAVAPHWVPISCFSSSPLGWQKTAPQVLCFITDLFSLFTIFNSSIQQFNISIIAGQ